MKRGILVAIFFFLSAQYGLGDIPQTISYQGLLTRAGGVPADDGDYNLTFTLYNMEVGGSTLWTETHRSVSVVKGVFNVILGSAEAPLNLTFDQQYWLGVKVGSGIELSPRIKLTSAAYSLNAKSVVNGAVTASKIADGAVTVAKIADNTVTAEKIQPNVVSSVDGVSYDGGNIDLAPQNAITITPNDSTNTITIGESHSARTDNPHSTTAAQTGAWSLTGNSGTTPGTNFLGTTDNKALELGVNNVRVLRLEPNTTSPNIIGGYNGNSITSGVSGATISGGGRSGNLNLVTDDYGTVGGGERNQAGDNAGTSSDRQYATVGGGWENRAWGMGSTVGGGDANVASGAHSTVGGGDENEASGSDSTVGGGLGNDAIGQYATVPGGYQNEANGGKSFAAGNKAVADHEGSFVWADNYVDAEYKSTRINQFRARAWGGTMLEDGTGLWIELNWNPIINTSTGACLSNTGIWTNNSDEASKENFAPVDGFDILRRLTELPISTWNGISRSAKAGPSSARHIGPMAQDFYRAFGVGEDDRHISTVDADGVALAAIQGLYEIVQAKEAENAALKQRVDALESRLAEIEALVKSLSK